MKHPTTRIEHAPGDRLRPATRDHDYRNGTLEGWVITSLPPGVIDHFRERPLRPGLRLVASSNPAAFLAGVSPSTGRPGGQHQV